MSKENTQILPVLDINLLQQKANEAALKGAMETIEDYYCKWSSPYRKGIEEELQKNKINFSFDLPDIVALINDSLSSEIDKIANKAIAETFIPLVRRALIREDKDIKFSKILNEFIESNYIDDNNDYRCEVNVDDAHNWLNIELKADDKKYSFTLHQTYESKQNEDKNPKYHLLSLPRNYESRYYNEEQMELSIEGATLKMPFRRDALQDNFTAFMARLIIGDCEITMDTDDFDEDMFEDRCYC
jgi:hypothetical protein